jgi:hypothetical protein
VITRGRNCGDCLFPRLIAKRESDVESYRIKFPGQAGKNWIIDECLYDLLPVNRDIKNVSDSPR